MANLSDDVTTRLPAWGLERCVPRQKLEEGGADGPDIGGDVDEPLDPLAPVLSTTTNILNMMDGAYYEAPPTAPGSCTPGCRRSGPSSSS
jgi:hypothetical protein